MRPVRLLTVAGMALGAMTFLHCAGGSDQQEGGSDQQEGFVASVSGDREITLSGPGAFFCVAAYESPRGKRWDSPPYLVVASARGLRENGITLTIPMGSSAGTYPLENVSPFEAGTKFEVRAELGSTVDYFDQQVEGTITLVSLPEGKVGGSMDPVRGSFEFSVSNSSGERATVTGSFDFPAPDPQDAFYCE